MHSDLLDKFSNLTGVFFSSVIGLKGFSQKNISMNLVNRVPQLFFNQKKRSVGSWSFWNGAVVSGGVITLFCGSRGASSLTFTIVFNHQRLTCFSNWSRRELPGLAPSSNWTKAELVMRQTFSRCSSIRSFYSQLNFWFSSVIRSSFV